jgi:hypothetical protein
LKPHRRLVPATFATEQRLALGSKLRLPAIVTECAESYVGDMSPVIGSAIAATGGGAWPRKLLYALLASALTVGPAGAVAAGSSDQPAESATPAKWAPRKLHFSYVAYTAYYSCDGFRDQVKSILQQLGAGDDLVVKSRGCTRLEGPEPFPGVDATFSVLEPAGGAGYQGAANSQNVAARWDSVTINSDTTRRTNEGACELIEQVKKWVLPLFTTRNLSFSSDCFPHTTTLAGARMSVEVLRPVTPPLPQSASP